MTGHLNESNFWLLARFNFLQTSLLAVIEISMTANNAFNAIGQSYRKNTFCL